MTQIIIINGKKRSGKDHFAKELRKNLTARGKTCDIMSFANPLKDIMAITLGVSHELLEELKNDEISLSYELCGAPGEWERFHINNFREVLQKFGTEGMKKYFGDDVWAKMLVKMADESELDFVLVPDFRFKIEEISPISVKILNDDVQSTDTHASEMELNDFEFFYEIDNTGYGSLDTQINVFVVNALGL